MHKLIVTKEGSKRVRLTPKEIKARKAEMLEAELELESTDYVIARREKYPPIEDQLNMIYHEGIRAWKAEIKKIKEMFPKP